MKKAVLKPYISPLGAWSLAIGTSIGWGSFVITSNTYLSTAGPLGSVIGMVIGAVVMMVIGINYHYSMNSIPDAGGIYAYASAAFGQGFGFLSAWFLGLTYLSVFWANATSLPLFARYFLGDVFRFGKLYTLFGYEVWLGEALFSIAAIVLFGLLLMWSHKAAIRLNIIMALTFTLCITVCFAVAFSGVMTGHRSIDPSYIPDHNKLQQVLRIAFISPWAFIGFENISHSVEEFRFHRKKAFRILTLVVIGTTLLYLFVILLSVTAYPPEYDTWLSYIRDLDHIEGIRGLPAFYAAQVYMGDLGVTLLMAALLALIITSLIGNALALSRLFYAMGKDQVLPQRFSKLNRKQIPSNAILLVVGISVLIPFLGRTAIGWIVDVTTVGATFTYGLISAAVIKFARTDHRKKYLFTGWAGLVLMVIFGAFLLMPNLLHEGSTMATESYFIFIVWSILGLFYLHWAIRHERTSRMGNSIGVWVILLSMIVFMSVVWLHKVYDDMSVSTIVAIQNHTNGTSDITADMLRQDPFIANELEEFHGANLTMVFSVIGLFALSIMAMVWNYYRIRKQEERTRKELGEARNLAYTDPLTGVKSKHAYVELEIQFDIDQDAGLIRDFALLVCDINGVKAVNDTQGHVAGDAYIRRGCTLICDHFKRSPVYRIGGDEFVVILQGSDYQNRDVMVEELNQLMEQNARTGELTISIGMSEYDPQKDHSFRHMFERADRDMYRQKKNLKTLGVAVRD